MPILVDRSLPITIIQN